MHTSTVAVCNKNHHHRHNKRSLITFLSQQDTSALQQSFLANSLFQTTTKAMYYDLPLEQTFINECEFYDQAITTTTFPLFLQYADGYQLVNSTLTLQKYTFQTVAKDKTIQDHLIKPLQTLGYSRRIYPKATTNNKRSVTFICIFPTEDSSYKENMEEKINNFVDINHFSGTSLYIHPFHECNLKDLNTPKNPIYTSLRDNIIDNYGYDDDLVDMIVQVQLLKDILVRSSHKYINDTETQHEMLQTRRRIAESTKTTVTRAKMMFLPVSYVPLSSKTKHMSTVAVKMGSTITQNHFHLQPWQPGDVIEAIILRDQKKMEQLIKKNNSTKSKPEINKTLQQWRVEQQRSAKSFPPGIIPTGKVLLSPAESLNSPILPGDTVIVFQKSSKLTGYQHYITVPVNSFNNYLTASLSSLELFLLTIKASNEMSPTIPQKRLTVKDWLQ